MTTAASAAPEPTAGSGFDPIGVARALLRSSRRASLATLGPDGAPYVSLVALATAPDGAPLLLVSNLARHAHNLASDPRASLLCADVGAGDPLAHPRVTLFGACVAVDKTQQTTRWLARHPESAMYFTFSDFHMLRLEPRGAHLVAGFGRIVDLSWVELRTDIAGAEGLVAAEEGIVAHMNEDHADATRLYATKLLELPDGDWRFEGVDPLGCEIALDGRAAYLPFSAPATTAGDVRKRLVELVAKARGG
ncbi:putative heme iron utilization protein [Methylopila capsulata]|uniref:Heme iron utilization protein n=1 Tax=Methylopila capsulata TaxID=61654 RepID=A0A9W6IXD5_9HYPH|nr:DUF2470 domain-containing protein [Methylopila capsulata]MBM7852841.1 putative heme iron utilization protein [Methylopila capsulata]GLK57050.1 pyridoxamine 5'-phosphate oxidase [Methylopila capsulata]